jgi:hypothetical protein
MRHYYCIYVVMSLFNHSHSTCYDAVQLFINLLRTGYYLHHGLLTRRTCQNAQVRRTNAWNFHSKYSAPLDRNIIHVALLGLKNVLSTMFWFLFSPNLENLSVYVSVYSFVTCCGHKQWSKSCSVFPRSWKLRSRNGEGGGDFVELIHEICTQNNHPHWQKYSSRGPFGLEKCSEYDVWFLFNSNLENLSVNVSLYSSVMCCGHKQCGNISPLAFFRVRENSRPVARGGGVLEGTMNP